jgi:hypothetical protein
MAWAWLVVSLCAMTAASAQTPGASAQRQEFQSLDEDVQGLKEEALKINHELMLLQEKLVYPSSTEVAVFVSVDGGKKFSLDSVELRIDEKVVTKHVYSYRELEALQQGGVQRLHTANLKTGPHQLAVNIAGKNAGNSGFSQGASFKLSKETGPKLVELKISAGGGGNPSITLQEWK